MRPIVSLTTDFGSSSPYLGQMRGVLLAINPKVQFVDITHAVPPQSVRSGALVLAECTPWFPPDSIHVAVIDPGVGTERGIVYAEIDGRHYVAPDNGLLSLLARDHSPSRIVACENREYWQPVISATFHGRDIMAPVAAHLSLGLDPGKLGPSLEDVLHLEWPEARILANKIEGEIVAVDSFGNLVTNITADMLAPAIGKPEVVVCCDEHETIGIYRTYGDHPPMTLIALVGSSGKLELAIVNDNARTMLGVCEGEKVIVKW